MGLARLSAQSTYTDTCMLQCTHTDTHTRRRLARIATRQRRMCGSSYFVFGNLTQALQPLWLSDITLFASEPDKRDCYKFGGFGCSSCLNFQIS